jgi:hypothetical protein
MQSGLGFDCLYFTTRVMGGGRGGREEGRGSVETRLVLLLERYVSSAISFSFFGDDDDPVVAVLRWLSISSRPVGSVDILSPAGRSLAESVTGRFRRTMFLIMKKKPTINGIVIAQTINIKTSNCI